MALETSSHRNEEIFACGIGG